MNRAFEMTVRRLRETPLWMAFVVSLTGYVILRLWFPFAPHYLDGPVADLNDLAPELGQGLAYGALILGLFGLYGLALERVRRRDRPVNAAWIFFAAAAYCVPLVTAFPINATDVYRYAIRGRVASVYGASPFESPPTAFPDDPFLPLAGEWSSETSPYGPLWEAVAASVTAAAPGNLWLNLLTFKGLAAVAHLLAGVAVWAIARGRGDGASASAGLLLAWTWNPSLLLIAVVDGHNDALMLLWLLVGWLLLARGRPVAGILVGALGALTKPIGLLALPFFLINGWRRLETARARWRFAFLGVGGVLVLAMLLFLPFGSPLALAMRLLREAGGAAGFSPSALTILVLQRAGVTGSMAVVGGAGTALMAAASLMLLWRAWRGRPPIRGVADIFLVYILQALPFRIWYTAWPFAWLLLDETGALRRRAGHLFLVISQLSVLVYGHFWRTLLGGDHLWSHALGVPIVFGGPWLLAWLSLRRSRSAGPNFPAPPRHS